jgi:hypothetical protein
VVQDTAFGLQLMKSKKSTIKKETKEQEVSVIATTSVSTPTADDTPAATVELSSEEQAIKALYAGKFTNKCVYIMIANNI